MKELENGWHIMAEGYMTSEPAYQKIMPMKACRAIENGNALSFVHVRNNSVDDKKTYVAEEVETLRKYLAYAAAYIDPAGRQDMCCRECPAYRECCGRDTCAFPEWLAERIEELGVEIGA